MPVSRKLSCAAMIAAGICASVIVVVSGESVARADLSQAVPPPRQSDFDPEVAGDSPVAIVPPTSMPATQPDRVKVYVDARGIRDEQIGTAIQRGVDFLLTQFKDGEIAPQAQLSASQRQALDALCVYAISHAGRAISDRRIDRQSPQLAIMLDKLCASDLASDGKVLNRPVVYGRSLRAAALAVNDRGKDRNVLKADVKWLIASQLGGAYSYDDTMTDLLRGGVKPMSERIGPDADEFTKPFMLVDDNFGGGSPDPTIGTGPYGPPLGPLPATQPSQLPGRRAVPPSGGGARPGSTPYQLQTPRALYWGPHQGITPGSGSWARAGAAGPKVAPQSATPERSRPTGPVGDNQVRPPDVRIEFPWDNSNSQYGLLGVWAGAEVGMEVPDAYWQSVEQHWISTQFKTGEWGYKKNDTAGYFAMTCAGIASLLVTHDYLDLPMLRGAVGREPYSPSLAGGLKWLNQADNSINTPNTLTHYVGYDLFGIERVGLASGYKYFGTHDWYREMTAPLLASQFENGAWGREDHGLDTIVETAYSLLFLSRGRHPVIMTKLKFDGAWDNRPRDVANLAKFVGPELEQPMNWQVVGIDHPWYDWFDSPVVFIASHQAPKLTEKNFAELHNFALAGGLIFTQADLASPAFDKWVKLLAEKVAPGHPLEPIPAIDPIYSINYKIPTHGLMGVRNGVRWLIVHSPSDVAMAWQQRSTKTRLADFQLGTNIFLYAAGKPELTIKNRLESPYIPAPTVPPTQAVRVARIRFDGNWDPEPAAWGRFSRYLQWETGVSLAIGAVPADKLEPGIAAVAALTGTGPVKFSDTQVNAIRDYVVAGGVLLVDPCGGDNQFRIASRESLLNRITKDAKPMPIMPDSILTRGVAGGPGTIPLRLRRYTLEKLGNAVGGIEVLTLGRGAVVISPRDLTFGLLGVQTWGVDGYRPDAAQTFMKNLIEWAATRGR